MSIKHAILGILGWKPSTGYELKKIFEESSAMYWSGNNNQIYKTLVQLLDDGFVTSEVQHQESAPTKKVYTITDDGLAELKEWVLSTPEPPELKKKFLIQLAWAELLNMQELSRLFDQYEHEVQMQIVLLREKHRRKTISPDRSLREVIVWNMISENLISSYQNELDWIQNTRQELFAVNSIEEEKTMKYQIVEKEIKKYIEITSVVSPLRTEQDAVDLVTLCGENDTGLLMIHSAALDEDFFKLKTGVAGKMMQKFVNYGIRVAVIVPQETAAKGRFREMVIETNRGNLFRVFNSSEEAEVWLLCN